MTKLNIFELVHADLAGPIEPAGKDGFRFALAFTDDYSGAVFTYFLKNKIDTAKATKMFIADVAPYGKIKCISNDQIMELILHLLYSLLSKNAIKPQLLIHPIKMGQLKELGEHCLNRKMYAN